MSNVINRINFLTIVITYRLCPWQNSSISFICLGSNVIHYSVQVLILKKTFTCLSWFLFSQICSLYRRIKPGEKLHLFILYTFKNLNLFCLKFRWNKGIPLDGKNVSIANLRVDSVLLKINWSKVENNKKSQVCRGKCFLLRSLHKYNAVCVVGRGHL